MATTYRVCWIEVPEHGERLEIIAEGQPGNWTFRSQYLWEICAYPEPATPHLMEEADRQWAYQECGMGATKGGQTGGGTGGGSGGGTGGGTGGQTGGTGTGGSPGALAGAFVGAA